MAKLFYDLNVPVDEDLNSTVQKVERLIKLGYHVIALNRLHAVTKSKKRKHSGKKPNMEVDDEEARPDTSQITVQRVSSMLKNKPEYLKILSRLTIILDNHEHVRELQNDFVQSFDIVAIQPNNEKLFQQACTQIENFDIICLDLNSKIPYRTKYTTLGAAVERGIFIEVSYASAIRSSSLRQFVLSNGISLVRHSKGRGIIMTSNAEHFMEIRGPYDIANLGVMFGMKDEKSKEAVTKNCHSAVLHAYSRAHTAKSVISMRKIGQPLNAIESIVKNTISIKNVISPIIDNEEPSVKRQKK